MDGSFTLYEDKGDSYDYEDGKYSLIPLTWDESVRKLTIGARTGSLCGSFSHETGTRFADLPWLRAPRRWARSRAASPASPGGLSPRASMHTFLLEDRGPRRELALHSPRTSGTSGTSGTNA
ncbi:DUF5110 domain-containing protein [Sorangium sp. So ce321]|uniref:DUF5110 domain-containing protein n=1 Tax=Sorangium sp. So ce321 TaxID=3133300 RepID=UPI003F6395A8